MARSKVELLGAQASPLLLVTDLLKVVSVSC
jgi:hypothetical protein